MKYCKKCVMPNTRPGLQFNEDGICQACLNNEKKNNTDWNARLEELRMLCDKHRGQYGKHSFDCLIAISGGKDSHTQVKVMKEDMGMNPLLVTVEDNFTMTKAGMHNIRNISESFGCQIVSLKPNLRAQKILMRKCLEKNGKPNWYLDRLIYTYPIRMALAFQIPLVVYGENVDYEYGGMQQVETPSAKNQIFNGVTDEASFENLAGDGVSEEDLHWATFPHEELKKFQLEPIYLSYFVRWNSYSNFITAKRYGFKEVKHEWHREDAFEYMNQIDSIGYLAHAWFKYLKFGHGNVTDMASRYVRYGIFTREEAIELVKKHDHLIDQRALDDFCQLLGYTLREFYDIAETMYNKDLFTKDHLGQWVLKNPIS